MSMRETNIVKTIDNIADEIINNILFPFFIPIVFINNYYLMLCQNTVLLKIFAV